MVEVTKGKLLIGCDRFYKIRKPNIVQEDAGI